ncbi:hypothetical protein Acid345_0061 [Candidatus Koribacter versatilis Ellin345]|uniref:Uncharacterized protein n=1 Tax=Koribacter versatilis (strain Ellin345) TaxID=204669 RepID=Q1IVN4_KORVE|nr:hypothetical protein [Candidatus Koribacter versatilis]ABF39066.1 hypothetical protein Acid345_0061 [Candidatus Koribacter versatilis Ellin345]
MQSAVNPELPVAGALWSGVAAFFAFLGTAGACIAIVLIVSVGLGRDEGGVWLPMRYAAIWVPITALVAVSVAVVTFRRVARRFTHVAAEIFDRQ